MPEIKGSAVYVEDGTKKTKLYDEKKHSCGDPMWKWVTKYIYMVLPLGTLWILSWIVLLLSTTILLYLYLDCRSPCSVAEVTAPPVSPANVEEKVQTQEEASVSNTLVNHGEINVSTSAPNPASVPPPSSEAKVIKIERRITRGIIPFVQ